MTQTDDRYFQAEIECMPREELERLQETRLLEILPQVYETSPLIKAAWTEAGVHPRDIRSIADFYAKAPLIDKDTIRRFRDETGDPFSGLLTDAAETWSAGTTSGTTGDPTVIPYVGRARGASEPATYLTSFTRGFWEVGIRPGDHVNFPLFTFRGHVFANLQRIGAVPVVVSHDPSQMRRLCELTLEFRPRAWYVMSSVLLLELERLEEAGVFDMRDVLKGCAIIWGGEPMGQRAQAALKRWDVEVFDHTAVGDVALAFECRERNGYHFPEDTALAEYHRVDSGEPADDNTRAELVVTSLDPEMPLLRFKSDDIVTVDRSTCACGRTHARIRIVGRVSDSFEIHGRIVLPAEIWLAVESIPEASAGLFQIVTDSRTIDTLRLRVGYEGTERSIQVIADALSASVHDSIGSVPDIELVPNEELLKLGPPHKIPRVVKK
jgi:phenylacetate-CoA ligase